MVSFQCEACGDVLTKKKLDQHVNRCSDAHFSCIDCMKTFYDYSYRAHTSCMTEEQKTHGALYKGNEKRQRAPKPAANGKMHTPTTPNEDRTLARLDVPPPAPSPPRASQAVNVFDFMVRQDSPASGASTPRKSNGGASPRSPPPAADVSYGSGPVRGGMQRFDSDASALKMQVDEQFAPTVNHTPLYKDAKTPQPHGNGHAKSTEKKRKRPQVDDLDLSDAVNDSSDGRRTTLHSGLTGGLTRLLTKPGQPEEDAASPLSPKKCSKHKPRPDESDDADESDEERRRRRKERRQAKHKRHRSDGDDMQLVRTDPAARQVELHASSSSRRKHEQAKHQLPEQANSEFFLSLVDKDHTSSKGQSIWGTLKTFHEGLQSDSTEDAFDLAGAHQRAEKRLFKGLRMKLNRHGEVVLFAKPDKEDE